MSNVPLATVVIGKSIMSRVVSLQRGAYRFMVCEQLADIVTDKGTDGDFRGAAHAPPPAVAGLEDFQGQLQALRDHPVLGILAVVFGHTGSRRSSTLQHSMTTSPNDSIAE